MTSPSNPGVPSHGQQLGPLDASQGASAALGGVPLSLEDPSLFLNREHSWLEFNQRVLDEACEPSAPLLERVKVLCIGASILDVVFMVRVAVLKQQLLSTRPE